MTDEPDNTVILHALPTINKHLEAQLKETEEQRLAAQQRSEQLMESANELNTHVQQMHAQQHGFYSQEAPLQQQYADQAIYNPQQQMYADQAMYNPQQQQMYSAQQAYTSQQAPPPPQQAPPLQNASQQQTAYASQQPWAQVTTHGCDLKRNGFTSSVNCAGGRSCGICSLLRAHRSAPRAHRI